jgi:N-acetylglucosaminyldiphosphoundecaprenol N-acetyl-beta-D-mannosaminyltransferase
MTASNLTSRLVLETRIDRTSYDHSARAAIEWASRRESRYLCFVPVYNVMSARSDWPLQAAMNGADIVNPDGMPLVWALRLLGVPDAVRVYGPDFTLVLLREAERNRIPVGFLGSTESVLAKLLAAIRRKCPNLDIAYANAPPFRPLTAAEDESVIQDINSSGARLLFVGLGCPKQELWMAAHRGRVQAVMVGVGAAFDFLAGTKPQAPRWMMAAGLEWLFRLATEPKRLWKRYLKYNPQFVFLFALQLLRARKSPARIA